MHQVADAPDLRGECRSWVEGGPSARAKLSAGSIGCGPLLEQCNIGQTVPSAVAASPFIEGSAGSRSVPEFRGQEVNRGLLANDVAEHKKPDRGGKVGVFGGDFGKVAAHFVDGEVLPVRNRTQQVLRCGFQPEAGRPSTNPDVNG